MKVDKLLSRSQTGLFLGYAQNNASALMALFYISSSCRNSYFYLSDLAFCEEINYMNLSRNGNFKPSCFNGLIARRRSSSEKLMIIIHLFLLPMTRNLLLRLDQNSSPYGNTLKFNSLQALLRSGNGTNWYH